MESLASPRSLEVARQFLHGELIAACAKHFQSLAKPYKSLSEAEQRTLMSAVHKDIAAAVRSAVELVCADGRYVHRATVEAVKFKEDGVKATLTLINRMETHDLADRAGRTVMIVNEDGRLYEGAEDIINALVEADQKPLFDSSTPNTMPARVPG